MIIGRITRVNGVKATATFFDRMQPFIVKNGQTITSPRINSFVKTGVGMDTVICQITGEHEAEYDRRSEVSREAQAAPLGPFVVDLEIRGHISAGHFRGGLRHLPIVGASVETLDQDSLHLLYAPSGSKRLRVGHSLFDESQAVYLDAEKLMPSHIGIFGNTGSGKSNTLASILKSYIDCIPQESHAAKIIIFDLNNEYGGDAIASTNKKAIFHLNTGNIAEEEREKLPLSFQSLDEDSWGTILRATQRTQMPIVRRAYYKWKNQKTEDYINKLKQLLLNRQSDSFFTLRSYCRDFITGIDTLNFNSYTKGFYYQGSGEYINSASDIKNITIVDEIDNLDLFYLWLVMEISEAAESGINFDFVQPLLPRAKSVIRNLQKVFLDIDNGIDILHAIFNEKPLAVIQLGNVNESSKEIIPSLLTELIMKRALKNKGNSIPREIITLVIDEAHNLLGYDAKQSDSIHANTLHIFEKTIKEGRKFGVFLCLASQRPSDISTTLTSQLHNYFIHKLVNANDIERIRKSVAFMGETSLSMLSALGQGECIVSGPSLHMPQYVYIDPLDEVMRPNSSDIQLFSQNGIFNLPFSKS